MIFSLRMQLLEDKGNCYARRLLPSRSRAVPAKLRRTPRSQTRETEKFPLLTKKSALCGRAVKPLNSTISVDFLVRGRASTDLVWWLELVWFLWHDTNLVVYLPNPWRAAGTAFRGLTLRPGADRSGQGHDVVRHRHLDVTRIEVEPR